MTNSPENCDPRQLKPHPQNVNIYGDEDIAELAASIEASGYIEPLVVTTNFVVVSGHRRLKAALSLGLAEVPIRMKYYTSENAVLEELLLANQYREKTTEQKGREARVWTAVLAEKARLRSLANLRNQTIEVEAASTSTQGKTRDEVAAIVGLGSGRNLNSVDRVINAIDESPPLVADAFRMVLKKSAETAAELTKVDSETVVKVGEVMRANPDLSASQAVKEVKREQQKEAHQQAKADTYKPLASLVQVLEGDMLAVLPTLSQKYQLVVADPPYNVTNQAWDKFTTPQAFLEQTGLWLDAVQGVLDDEYNLFWFCFPTYTADIELILRERFTIQSRIVWHRRNMATGSDAKYKFLDTWEMCFHCGNRPLNYPDKWDDSRFDVQVFASPQQNFTTDVGYHPTQKPLELIKRLVSFGSYEGDFILDPFGGSGTTGEAALLAGGRNCTLIEREPKYIQVINERLGLK